MKRCPECGGRVRPLALAGRYDEYKGLRLEIPAHLEIPTCESCGEEFINAKSAKAVDNALEELYRKTLTTRLLRALDALRGYATLQQLEKLLKVSQGYLSKLRSGEKSPSPLLVQHLVILAARPEERIKEAERVWEEPASEPNEVQPASK
jgi:hypothetical protein